MQFVDFTKNTLFFCHVRRASPTSIFNQAQHLPYTPRTAWWDHFTSTSLSRSEWRTPGNFESSTPNTAAQGTLSYYAQDRKEIKGTTQENRWWQSIPDTEAFRGWWIARNTFTNLSVRWCDMDEAMLPKRPWLYSRGWDGTWKNDTGVNCRKTLEIEKCNFYLRGHDQRLS